MAQTSFRLDDEVDMAVESRLSYGDTKSEWLRHAVKLRLHVDPILDDLYDSYQHEERVEFVTAAVYEKVHEELEKAIDDGHPQRMESMLGPEWRDVLDRYDIEFDEE